ncbi:TPA: hypothetical protein SLN67_004417 [Serratia marcescens]|nr:hypothetical protein [Serratia marcescens]
MKLDQCLFGYNDGHRLLASSLPLGAATSLLTELSDLAPGTVFGGSDGYWTGVPVPLIGRYALMRTWPAPEMPRPGCVWTHVLLIEPTLLESINDLSVLQSSVIRPIRPLDISVYSKTLEVDIQPNRKNSDAINDVIVQKLISSLYEMMSATVEVTSPGELDAPLFAIWSQQWPRLRRNFRFQSAGSRFPRANSSTRFDITAVLTHQAEELSKPENTAPTWLSSATLDAIEGTRGNLRTFLWTYGRDVRKQRGSFRPLAEINILNKNTKIKSAQRVIDLVTDAFPSLDDAVYLKQDLIDGKIISHEQVDLIRLIILSEIDGVSIFPPPTSIGLARLMLLWPQYPDEILPLAELTVKHKGPIGKIIFEKIISIIQTPEFWPLTNSYPKVREQMVNIRPDLLINTKNKLDDTTLIEFLPFVSAKTQGLPDFIESLISHDSELLVKVVLDSFPNIAAIKIVTAFNDKIVKTNKIWLEGLIKKPTLLLQDDIMERITRTSLLYDIADSLGWLSSTVISVGITPWYKSVTHATDDIFDNKSDYLSCFLISLVFISGGKEGFHVIEKLYDKIHKKILRGKLSLNAMEILLPQLPDIGWISNWDHGRRFRLAVVNAYIRNGWPLYSFSKLTEGQKNREMLAKAASEIPGGNAYFDAVSR